MEAEEKGRNKNSKAFLPTIRRTRKRFKVYLKPLPVKQDNRRLEMPLHLLWYNKFMK
jgi:hypothetical protein